MSLKLLRTEGTLETTNYRVFPAKLNCDAGFVRLCDLYPEGFLSSQNSDNPELTRSLSMGRPSLEDPMRPSHPRDPQYSIVEGLSDDN